VTDILTPTSIVRTRSELRAILPPEVEAFVDDELLRDAWSAAALRVLATIRNDFWHRYIGRCRIDWAPLLDQARALYDSRSVLERAELAASLAGRDDARVNLMMAARVLDRANFVAFLDAQRILLEGLSA
jgi:hypothetical protein